MFESPMGAPLLTCPLFCTSPIKEKVTFSYLILFQTRGRPPTPSFVLERPPAWFSKATTRQKSIQNEKTDQAS